MQKLAVALALVVTLSGCDSREGGPLAFAGQPRATSTTGAPSSKGPLRVAFSDSPGWTAFEIGIEKGWFKKAGIDVEFSRLDYFSSLDAFSSGNADAFMVTNADALVTGANGAKSKMILLTDYSNGNDQIVARSGIDTFRDLKGKRVGLELTLVDHLLFLKACERNGMKATDVELVNLPTDGTPEALTSGDVAAVAAWYPVSAQALRFASGARSVFTSADVPGLIYDGVAVSPASLLQRREEWVKFVRVWYRISDFIRSPKTRDQAVAIMAARVGVKPEEYAAGLSGTYLLSLEEAKTRYTKGPGLDSLYGSTRVVDDFNVSHKVYREAQPVDEYIDPSIVTSL